MLGIDSVVQCAEFVTLILQIFFFEKLIIRYINNLVYIMVVVNYYVLDSRVVCP